MPLMPENSLDSEPSRPIGSDGGDSRSQHCVAFDDPAGVGVEECAG